MAIITLTTDFGEGSPYVAQMKGAVLARCPAATIVDVTHRIAPQNVPQGAFVLNEVADRFPAGTVHVVVVDPGVGTDRPILAARLGTWWVVAPDNGLVTLAADRVGVSQAVHLSNAAFWAADVSATFHGRDIMAPVAAHLVQRQSLENLGPAAAPFQRLPWPAVTREADSLRGEIVAIDTFGNAITNIGTHELAAVEQAAARLRARTDDGEWDVVRTYGERPAGTTVALFGSSGLLEIAVVNGNAAEQCRLRIGSPVWLRW